MNAITLVRLLTMLTALCLTACTDNGEVRDASPAPVHFESGDECHVCGMIITRFPGPRGEAITAKEQQVHKFCSTRDMFAWALQPENAGRNHTLYVHDMGQTHWEHPDDTALIDAREAYYVVGSGRHGAMGPTLASFASAEAARAFIKEYGGQLLSFSEITLAHLNPGPSGQEAGHMPAMSSHHGKGEHAVPEHGHHQ